MTAPPRPSDELPAYAAKEEAAARAILAAAVARLRRYHPDAAVETLVGSHWDWGDALTGCWVAAALEGLSSSGMESQKVVRRKRPAIRMVQV